MKIYKIIGVRVLFMENNLEFGILSGIFVFMENDIMDGNFNIFFEEINDLN